MDKIVIRQYRVPVLIGLLPEERQSKQFITLDLEFQINTAHASQTDELRSTIDYAAVCNYLNEFLNASQFQLIETLAEKLAEGLLGHFSLSWLRLIITKKPKGIPQAEGGVSVVIERSSSLTSQQSTAIDI